MNNLLLLWNLFEEEGDAATTTVTEQVSYSMTEMIIWYSALVLAIVILIIYLKSDKNKQKKLNKVVSEVGQDAQALQNAIEKMEETNDKKIIGRELGTKIAMHLQKHENVFSEMKEISRLSDFDNLISTSAKLRKKLNKLPSEYEQYLKDIKVIQSELIKHKGKIELVVPLVK